MTTLFDEMNPGIVPIIKVLLETFPWLAPEKKEDFTFSMAVANLYPTLNCQIKVWTDGDLGHMRFEEADRIGAVIQTGPTKEFALSDPIEAVGIVSDSLPEWMKTVAFTKSTFHLAVSNYHSLVDDLSQAVLFSPSGATSRPYRYHYNDLDQGIPQGPWVAQSEPYFQVPAGMVTIPLDMYSPNFPRSVTEYLKDTLR
jgi:hypothetical protein